MKKIKFIASVILTGILAFSCATNSGTSKSTSKIDSSKTTVESTAGEIVPSESTVKYLGRTLEKNGTLYFAQTASGIEFKVENTKSLTLNLVGDSTARPTRGELPGNLARYTVFVDGKEVITDSMTKQKLALEVFNGDTKKDATIRIIKITEASQSNMGIKTIVVDPDAKVMPTAAKDLKIEFIGDSITCGYGVEETNGGAFTTQTENAAKAYAYLTAENLNADYSIVSYSGFGIYSGFTSGERNETSLVPPNYEYITYTWNDGTFNKKPWDFKKFQPDFVVINLGTNDASYCKDSSSRADFEDAYVDFLKDIRAKNPKAHIICALGTMGQDLYYNIEEAVSSYKKSTKDEKVSTYKFPVQNQAVDGVGADWHPSIPTQKKSAAMMTEFIKSLM